MSSNLVTTEWNSYKEITYALVEEAGINTDVFKSVSLDNEYSRKAFYDTAFLLKNRIELLAWFSFRHISTLTTATDYERFVKNLQDDDEIVFAMSRAYEFYIDFRKRGLFDEDDESVQRWVKPYLNLQLDAQAVDKTVDFLLHGMRDTEAHIWISATGTTGILHQKALTKSQADALLTKYPTAVFHSLVPSRFSKEKLKSLAVSLTDNTADVRVPLSTYITNPYLSDMDFSIGFERMLQDTRYNYLKDAELSPERFWFLKKKYSKDRTLLVNLAANPFLPREIAEEIYNLNDAMKRIYYSKPNANILFSNPEKMKEIFHSNQSMFNNKTMDSMSSSEDIDRLLETVGFGSNTKILLSSPYLSKETMIKILLYLKIDDTVSPEAAEARLFIRTHYYAGDNPWSLTKESQAYSSYRLGQKQDYNDRLQSLLSKFGFLVETNLLPLSWQIKMLDVVALRFLEESQGSSVAV